MLNLKGLFKLRNVELVNDAQQSVIIVPVIENRIRDASMSVTRHGKQKHKA